MKLFIVEKTRMATDLILWLREVKQQEHGKDFLVVSVNGIGWMQLSPPKLSIKQIPYTGGLFKHPRSTNVLPSVYVSCLPDLAESSANSTGMCYAPIESVIKAYSKVQFSSASVLVSPDTCGHYVSKEILELFGVDLEIAHWHDAKAWLKQHVFDALESSKSINDIAESAMRHQLKREFDGLWLANSQWVFGRIFQAINAPQTKTLSKYELTVLCLLERNLGRMRVRNLMLEMDSPKGTGKYTSKTATIGTPATQCELIASLSKMELVKADFDDIWLTTKGRKFLSCLHPKTRDFDFPFRVDSWLREGEVDDIKKQMLKYLKQLFGRQLRYQSSRFFNKIKEQ